MADGAFQQIGRTPRPKDFESKKILRSILGEVEQQIAILIKMSAAVEGDRADQRRGHPGRTWVRQSRRKRVWRDALNFCEILIHKSSRGIARRYMSNAEERGASFKLQQNCSGNTDIIHGQFRHAEI